MEPVTVTLLQASDQVAPQLGFLEGLLASGLSWVLAFSPSMAPLVAILAAMGTMRVLFKPLMAALVGLAKMTPTRYDDNLLENFQRSKVYTSIAWVLDFIASIKLPSKK